MGASASEIEIETERDDRGGVSVVATWIKPENSEMPPAPGDEV
ncbi:hypothetical protein [Arthrobacter sp. efr-133-R2A-63]|nr:hypothetical protein [Arthrobacter sp. efr-133-R2A-63]